MYENTIHHEQAATLRGAEVPVRTRWSYRAAEPFAVTVSFCSERGRWVEWIFARELLLEGLAEAAGVGDVRLCPDPEDEDLVLLEIRSPSGDAAFELERAGIVNFVADTLDLVPAGDEADHFDVDRLLGEITGS